MSEPAVLFPAPVGRGEGRMVTGRFLIVTLATFAYFLALGALLQGVTVEGRAAGFPVLTVPPAEVDAVCSSCNLSNGRVAIWLMARPDWVSRPSRVSRSISSSVYKRRCLSALAGVTAP